MRFTLLLFHVITIFTIVHAISYPNKFQRIFNTQYAKDVIETAKSAVEVAKHDILAKLPRIRNRLLKLSSTIKKSKSNWRELYRNAEDWKTQLKGMLESHEAALIKAFVTDPIIDKLFTKVFFDDLNDFRQENYCKLFKNKKNRFISREELSIIFYSRNKRSWVLRTHDTEVLKNNPVLGNRIPVADCMNSLYGSDGSVGTAFLVLLKLGANIKIGMGILNADPNNVDEEALVAGTLSLAAIMGNGVKISGTVTCLFLKGTYVQPYIIPYLIEIPRGKQVRVRLQKGVGIVEQGEWVDTKPFTKIAAISPVVECAVGNYSVCDSGAVPGQGIQEFESFFKEVSTRDDSSYEKSC